jgi:hypothetical protein
MSAGGAVRESAPHAARRTSCPPASQQHVERRGDAVVVFNDEDVHRAFSLTVWVRKVDEHPASARR